MRRRREEPPRTSVPRDPICPEAATFESSVGVEIVAALLQKEHCASDLRDGCSVTKGESVDVSAELSSVVRRGSAGDASEYFSLRG
jgi:hypothetical protein